MRILLTGKTGQVGRELQRALAPFGAVVTLDRAQMDLTDPDSIRKTVREVSPSVIVNAAGYTAVDKAESEPELAMQVNGAAPGVLAEEAKRLGALLVHYSTDYVYGGGRAELYTEEDAPGPVNAYGRSKLEGERAIAAAGCAHLIFRPSWIYSTSAPNFVLTILKLARERNELRVVTDQTGSPSWARELALATARVLGEERRAREAAGIYHLSASGYTTRLDFAKRILEFSRELSGNAAPLPALRPVVTAEYPLPAVRPLHVRTSNEKFHRMFGFGMPHWEQQLRACLGELLDAGGDY